MEESKLSKLNDEELQVEKKKLKKRKIINATLIGFLAGIFFMGVAALVSKKSPFGIIPMLITLFLIYKLANNSKKDKALEEIIKERNLN